MSSATQTQTPRLRSCRWCGQGFIPEYPNRWWCTFDHYLFWRDREQRPTDAGYDRGWHDGYTTGYTQGHQDGREGLPLLRGGSMEQFAVALHLETAPSPRRLDRWAEAKDQGIITGWGAIYGELVQTWVPTRLMPGCFTRTLASKPPSAVKVLVKHDTKQPAGVARKLEDVPSKGLYCELQLDLNVGYVQDMFSLVKSGAIDSLSIGFDPIRFELRNEEGIDGPVRLLHDVELAEISGVTWGASPTAKITGTHASRSAGQTSRRYATPQDRAIALAEAEFAALSLTGSRAFSLDDMDRMLMDASLQAISLQELGTPDMFSHRRAQLARQARDGSLDAPGLVELRRLRRARGLVQGQAADEQLTRATAWAAAQSRHPWR